ncbi:MAG: CdvA-like protein [Desulfurococcales archaeon]|nr:CdvA-like protein [Desulfurococcales archaeon]
MALKIETLANAVGSSLVDEYGRDIGTLVSLVSDVDGYIQHVEVKIVDRGVERIPGDRIRLRDGKLVIVPEWKYNAMKVIEGLDRAYRRRKALENIASSGDIPAEVVDGMKRKLSEEIKKLKINADNVKKEVKSRIARIDDELLHIASAIANLQMLYFSGEVSERGYTQGMNHLRKLKESLSAEKSDAKSTLDRLEKTLEIASGPYTREAQPVKKGFTQQPKVVEAPAAQEESLVIKIEE